MSSNYYIKHLSICIVEKMAEALVPGQSENLLQLAHWETVNRNNRAFNQEVDTEMVENLKRIYKLYCEKRMPFIEQVRLLSLLPRSWKYEIVMENFGCSTHAIKLAHKMHDEQEYFMGKSGEPSTRQRADPETVKHFITWLVESNTLVSGE